MLGMPEIIVFPNAAPAFFDFVTRRCFPSFGIGAGLHHG